MHFRRPTQQTRNERSLDDAILPLTNIVFLLLIFFMLAGRLATPEPFTIQPPQSTSKHAADTSGIDVQIGRDGQLAMDGKTQTISDLQAAVAARLKQSPDTAIQLRADGSTRAERVVEIMQRLHAAGAQKLRLITVSPDRR
ncbi:MAG: biopolymer transporter ExbD [Salinisphaera sp.]|jgi:biopolymer transport protein ExbD|nr:biopolymer transporter ExbD [Salinisphaera sp.]